MDDVQFDAVTAFSGGCRVAAGSRREVIQRLIADRIDMPIVLADATGRTVDLDLRSLPPADTASDSAPPERAARGRPKLGVVAREVTLLPRHWDWLNGQPGGASAALRRLVDQARKATGDADAARLAQDVAYRAMTTLAGNLPNYEEATRALFARAGDRFAEQTSAWPADIRDYVTRLAATCFQTASPD